MFIYKCVSKRDCLRVFQRYAWIRDGRDQGQEMVRMGKGVGKRWKRPRGCKESGLGRPRVGCVWAGETKKGFKSKTKWITWAPSGPRDSRAKDPSFCGSNIREPDYLRH